MNITERILYLHPDAKFVCWGNDYNLVDWSPLNPFPKPSLEVLEALSQQDVDTAMKQEWATLAVDANKILNAAMIWVAGRLNESPATVRSEIISIYKSL